MITSSLSTKTSTKTQTEINRLKTQSLLLFNTQVSYHTKHAIFLLLVQTIFDIPLDIAGEMAKINS